MRVKNYIGLFNLYVEKFYNYYVWIEKLGSLLPILFILKYEKTILCDFFLDLCVTDYLYFKKRFRLAYNICSSIYKKCVWIVCSLFLLQTITSIYKVFKSSIWLEREVYDMFGIKFINNWDLRRILTDYTFFGFPLRKDFPLSGYVELCYDERKRTTFEVLVEFMQEMRFFYVSSSVENWDVFSY